MFREKVQRRAAEVAGDEVSADVLAGDEGERVFFVG
jgi:hypothetical protein